MNNNKKMRKKRKEKKRNQLSCVCLEIGREGEKKRD